MFGGRFQCDFHFFPLLRPQTKYQMEEGAGSDAVVLGGGGRDTALLGVLQDLEDLEARDKEMQTSFHRLQVISLDLTSRACEPWH